VTSRQAGAAELLDGPLADLVVERPDDLDALARALERARRRPRRSRRRRARAEAFPAAH
jgi:hypothetical protein